MPGLIAYIAMLTAVVSTALSIVREKEAGTMEQVRMSPIGPRAVRGRQDGALLRRLARLGAGHRGAAMVLFDMPVRGSWVMLLGCVSLFLVGALAFGVLISTHCRDAAGGVSDRAPDVVHADADALGIHLPDLQHAGVPAGGHLRGAGALFPGGLRGIVLKGVGMTDVLEDLAALVVFAVAVLGLASLRLKREWA